MFLQVPQNSQEYNCVRASFLIKLLASDLQLITLAQRKMNLISEGYRVTRMVIVANKFTKKKISIQLCLEISAISYKGKILVSSKAGK